LQHARLGATVTHVTIPRWLSALVWWVGVPFVHGVVPWAISRFGVRQGWVAQQPAAWNLVGLGPVAAGAALLAWVSLGHLAHAKDGVEVSVMSRLLVTQGPYAWSRNPMYVAELTLWLGWAVLFGSVPVIVGAVGLWAAMTFIALPWEERALEARFGESYLGYKRRVPRWLGRRAGGR
jgi:protein-S-isoprenylcysteine O-methyltransferase Ste14